MSRCAAAALLAVVAGAITGVALRAQGDAAYFVRSLDNPAERREARADILDTPVLPGSVMKVVTLAAALESHVIEPDTARMCRRTVTINGRRYTCSHPDLKRPLTPAEALAHSCNDFFVSLAPRLTRAMFNQVRGTLGLPPVSATADLAASFVGLDGPRVTPRTLLDIVARLAGADPQRPVRVAADTRRVLGCHIVGPAAGEMVQLAAVAIRMGATKEDFDRTLAVHPTMAEEIVTLRAPVRRSSGRGPEARQRIPVTPA